MMEDQVDLEGDSDVDVNNGANSVSESKYDINLKRDKNLKLSTNMEDVEIAMKNYVKYYDKLEDKLKCSNTAFPTDYELVHMSSMCYNDVEHHQDLTKDWMLLTQACNTDLTNGYYGCAYFNAEHQLIVIAHRGTSSLKALWNDLRGIRFSKYVPQMNSATTFTQQISSLVSKFNQNGAYLKLSFTGHSLGGWLAQITTFTAKYLTLDEQRDNGFSLMIDTRTGYHSHTVVFDSPGCKRMLDKLMVEYVRYDEDQLNRVSIESLDITTYLSAPNRINCFSPHVGKLYTIFFNLSDSNHEKIYWNVASLVVRVAMFPVNWIRKKLRDAFDSHRIDNFFKCFDPQTGLVRRDDEGKLRMHEVIDWPISEGLVFRSREYREFCQWISQFNHCRSQVNEVHKAKIAIRYHTKEVVEQNLKYNVFSRTEINFVQSYDFYIKFPHFDSIIFSLDTMSTRIALESVFETLQPMKFELDSDRQMLVLDPNVKPVDFISYVKQLNHFFPHLNVVKRSTKDFAVDLVALIYQTKSSEYLTPIKGNSLQFDVRSFNLNHFLNQENTQFLVQVENKTSVGALKIFKIFESIKSATKFNDGNSLFLDVKTILQLSKLGFAPIFQSSEQFLLVIESNENSEEALDCLKSIFEKARGNEKIKIILIVDHVKRPWNEIVGKYEESPHEGIILCDLSSDSRNEIVNKELIKLQGSSLSLAQIIPELQSLNSLTDLIQSASDVSKLDVSSDHLRNSRYDVFAVSNTTVDGIQAIVPPGEQVELYEEGNQIEVRFVVLDNVKAENQFESICWQLSHKSHVHWLNWEENQLILKDSRSHCVENSDKFIEELLGEKLGTPVREVLSGCFVTGEDLDISLVGKELLKSVVSTDVLMKLGNQEEIEAGNALPNLGEIEDYYIGRRLTKMARLIYPISLRSNKNDVFAIGKIDVDEFLKCNNNLISVDQVIHFKELLVSKHLLNIKIIIVDRSQAENQYNRVCKIFLDRNIHWVTKVNFSKHGSWFTSSMDYFYNLLENDPDGYTFPVHFPQCMFTLVRSRIVHANDDLESVDGSLVYDENCEVSELLSMDDINDRVVTVVGLPGMGKSTFFTHLALQKKQLYPSLWVIIIKLNAIRNWDLLSEFSTEQVTEFLTDILKLKSEFERSLLGYCLCENKVVVILDAFDEASPKYDKQMFGLFKALQEELKVKQLWLSSRAYALKDQRLMGAVYTLQALHNNDQKKFLLKFWTKRLNLNIDEDRCNSITGRLLESFDHSKRFLSFRPVSKSFLSFRPVSEISLTLKVVAQYYQDDFKKIYEDKRYDHKVQFKKVNVHVIYEKVIRKQVELVTVEKQGADPNQQAVEIELEKRVQTAINEHQLLALVSCKLDYLVVKKRKKIDELMDGIDRGQEITGLVSSVVNGVPQFIHATFAEYLAARWLIEQMEKIKDNERLTQLLKGLDHLFNLGSAVVYSHFNSQLGKNADLEIKLAEHLKSDMNLVKSLDTVCENGYAHIFKFLLKLGFIDNSFNNKIQDLLQYGVVAGEKEIVEYVCCDLYRDRSDFASIVIQNLLLIYACQSNVDTTILCILLDRVEREKLVEVINFRRHRDQLTALHKAADNNRLEAAKMLIENGADVGLPNRDGFTALDVAIKSRKEQMVKLLLDSWVTQSPIELIVKSCEYIQSEEMVDTFVNFVKKCHEQSLGSSSMLLPVADDVSSDVTNAVYCYQSNERFIISLIKNIALKYPNYLSELFCCENDKREIVLHIAARLGYVAAAELMFSLGADKIIPNYQTLIRIATSYRQVSFVKWSLSKIVANVNSITDPMSDECLIELLTELADRNVFSDRDTILHVAVDLNFVIVAKMIIDRDANIDVRNFWDLTPLSLACKRGYLEMTRMLIGEGASVNDDHEPPLLQAVCCGSIEIVQLLIEKGADVNAKFPFTLSSNRRVTDCTLLHVIALQSFHEESERQIDPVKMAKILIVNGANVNATTLKFKITPLHLSKLGTPLTDLLIRSGGNINAINSDGLSVVKCFEKQKSVNQVFWVNKVVRSIFLFSACNPPKRWSRRITSAKGGFDKKLFVHGIRLEKEVRRVCPELDLLVKACKAKDMGKIQRHLNAILVNESAFNQTLNHLNTFLREESAVEFPRVFGRSRALIEFIKFVQLTVSILIKKNVHLETALPFFDKLKLLSMQCDEYCLKNL